MREVTIRNIAYRTGQLDAFQQWHIVRRIAPLVPGLVKLFRQPDGAPDMMSAFDELANALAKMTDADSEYILKTCLSAVQRQEKTGWARIVSARGDLMYSDIDLAVMLQLAPAVMEDNLTPFLAALRQMSPAGAQTGTQDS